MDTASLCLEGGGGLPFIVSEVPRQSLVLKEGECFLYTYENGEMAHGNRAGLGLYYRDTRYLSTMETRIEDVPLLLLSSSTERGYIAEIHLSNPDLVTRDGANIPQDTMSVRRSRLIHDGFIERCRVRNFHTAPVRIGLSIGLAADFADIFEVRGMRRERRGTVHRPARENDGTLLLSYTGRDRMRRITRIEFSRRPDELRMGRAGIEVVFFFLLDSYEEESIDLHVIPLEDGEDKPALRFEEVRDALRESYDAWLGSTTKITTDNAVFDLMIQHSMYDLRTLSTRTRYGEIVTGGVPWYSTPFGRDALITCLEALLFKPELARDSLLFLAAFQGREVNDWRDEEPGKIIHEIRQGEMARMNEIPHTPYYGTVDATPLFLVLMVDYLKWTGDLETFHRLRDNVDAALGWIDDYGDVDGDGLVEYSRRSSMGLSNQFWKDSGDSILLPGGRLPVMPVATVETQGYVYYAKRHLGEVFLSLGEEERGRKLLAEAENLQQRVEESFWDDELGFYVLALDGAKNPVRVVSSNGGQLLFTGLPSPQRAKRAIARLTDSAMFSGWGIRTLSESEYYYNPMSYHNGSIWPHDNALILKGIKLYEEHRAFIDIMEGIHMACMRTASLRLPELFCGFKRTDFNEPVPYPVACSPQAWASGSLFLLLQFMLGLSPESAQGVLHIDRPLLPPWLEKVELKGLRVGRSRLDLLFRREEGSTVFSVTNKEGGIRVVVEE
ncbi:MAG: amylo-alpha-1,6-glucosidase [Actinobacteria bacterium]|jgi:glycogen debranching enzyme|nr:MAG: amylo-alpha-1,6-glucosidase [Actinomycetota bacterium]